MLPTAVLASPPSEPASGLMGVGSGGVQDGLSPVDACQSRARGFLHTATITSGTETIRAGVIILPILMDTEMISRDRRQSGL